MLLALCYRYQKQSSRRRELSQMNYDLDLDFKTCTAFTPNTSAATNAEDALTPCLNQKRNINATATDTSVDNCLNLNATELALCVSHKNNCQDCHLQENIMPCISGMEF